MILESRARAIWTVASRSVFATRRREPVTWIRPAGRACATSSVTGASATTAIRTCAKDADGNECGCDRGCHHDDHNSCECNKVPGLCEEEADGVRCGCDMDCHVPGTDPNCHCDMSPDFCDPEDPMHPEKPCGATISATRIAVHATFRRIVATRIQASQGNPAIAIQSASPLVTAIRLPIPVTRPRTEMPACVTISVTGAHVTMATNTCATDSMAISVTATQVAMRNPVPAT